jgi:hypothetical protein
MNLEESSKKGLLGSPAIIPQVIFTATADDQIFVDENLGFMVVIENPSYMRKDLPKWVPQILTVSMSGTKSETAVRCGKTDLGKISVREIAGDDR